VKPLAHRTFALRVPYGIVSALLLMAAAATPPSRDAVHPEPPALGGPGCPWPELSGERLLDRRLGSISFTNAALWQVWKELVEKRGVPLSLIEDPTEARVTLNLPSCTVRQLLDQIVARTAGYRYGFVGPHLVLYSTNPWWQTRIEDLGLKQDGRWRVMDELLARLSPRAPSAVRIKPAGELGDLTNFIFDDEVRVTGPATVVELLLQLLGHRTSAVLAVSSWGFPPPGSLSIEATPLLQSLDVTAPTTTLRRRGETVQLKVTGLLRDGTRQDLTAGACGTLYRTLADHVEVSSDGLVTAAEDGEPLVLAVYDNKHALIGLHIDLSHASQAPRPRVSDLPEREIEARPAAPMALAHAITSNPERKLCPTC
jgi:hypothetical protein